METTRQQKIAKQIQRDMAEIFQKEGAEIVRGVLVTVTAVRVSPDFSYAKIYVSVFPFEQNAAVMATLEQHNWFLRRALGQRIRNQLKTVPEIQFFLDDSLEYIEQTTGRCTARSNLRSAEGRCSPDSLPAAIYFHRNPVR